MAISILPKKKKNGLPDSDETAYLPNTGTGIPEPEQTDSYGTGDDNLVAKANKLLGSIDKTLSSPGLPQKPAPSTTVGVTSSKPTYTVGEDGVVSGAGAGTPTTQKKEIAPGVFTSNTSVKSDSEVAADKAVQAQKIADGIASARERGAEYSADQATKSRDRFFDFKQTISDRKNDEAEGKSAAAAARRELSDARKNYALIRNRRGVDPDERMKIVESLRRAEKGVGDTNDVSLQEKNFVAAATRARLEREAQAKKLAEGNSAQGGASSSTSSTRINQSSSITPNPYTQGVSETQKPLGSRRPTYSKDEEDELQSNIQRRFGFSVK